MPRTVPAGLLSSPYRCIAALVIRTDGTLEGMSDATVAFNFNGYPTNGAIFPNSTVTYQSMQGLDVSNIAYETGTNVDNLELNTLADDVLGFVTTQDIIGTRYENSRVLLFEIDYTNPSNGCMVLNQYRLSKANITDTGIALTLMGLLSFLKQITGRSLNPYCDVEKFGNLRCDPGQTIRTALSASRTVGAVQSLFTTDFFGDSRAAGFYSFGDATFTHGNASGLIGAIKLHTVVTPSAYAGGTTYGAGDYVTSSGVTYTSLQAANTGHTPASNPTWWLAVTGSPASVCRIVWRTPLPYALAVGDIATLCFGCDRTPSTCKTVANSGNPSGTNIENGQFFKLPDPDVIKIVGR